MLAHPGGQQLPDARLVPPRSAQRRQMRHRDPHIQPEIWEELNLDGLDRAVVHKVLFDGLGAGRVVRDPGPGRVPIPADQTPFDHLPRAIPSVHRAEIAQLPDSDPGPATSYRPDSDDAPLYLQIRWRDHAPVRLDRAYLSAQVPGVEVRWPGRAPVSIPMTTTLLPQAGDVGQFSLQATQGPSVTAPRSWAWNLQGPASPGTTAGERPIARFDPIAFSAVNISETQQENVRAFLAGVLLGIAGGAVITLIAELVKIRRVRAASDAHARTAK